MHRAAERCRQSLRLLMAGGLLAAATNVAQASCDRPVYLTIDTGHMGVALGGDNE